ncbi:MAG: glycosyltransferase family 87 protein, partial [Flavobacteriales bacterium]
TGLVVVVHLHRELHLGNVNVMLLWVLLFALDRLLAGKHSLGGALIGLAILTKPHFVVLLPLLLLRREFKATGIALLTVLMGIAVPALFLGVSSSIALHQEWLGEMARHNASLIYRGSDNYNAVNTVYSFLHRLVLKYFIATPSSLETYVLLAIIACAFGLLVLWKLRRGDAKSFVFEYLLLVALVPSITLTDTEHFLLALPLVAYVMHHLAPKADPRWLALVAAPILFGYGGNWEDALGPTSDWMIHHGVLGMANVGLLVLSVFLFLRDGRSNLSEEPVSMGTAHHQ